MHISVNCKVGIGYEKLPTQLQTTSQGSDTDITKLKRSVSNWALFNLKFFQKMRMSKKMS